MPIDCREERIVMNNDCSYRLIIQQTLQIGISKTQKVADQLVPSPHKLHRDSPRNYIS